MARSKLYYWNRDWPGHVGFCIDLEAMSGGETRVTNFLINALLPLGATGLGNYVSWTANGVMSAKALTGISAYARSFEEDLEAIGRPADKMIEIPGLDIQAMKQEWLAIRTKQGATWNLLTKSCAVVALRVMRAGGADDLVPSWSKRNPGIITPQAVWVYAKSAAKHAAG
ncbi:MAG: hypothetical protein K1X57_11660 [Gemmataceae bacterium]|nr:hypothetical protein [Gemmataceae bacterium]